MQNKLKTFSIIGVFFLIIGGSLLHFTYNWSGFNPIVGLFSSVNESVWEHLKLGFGSLLFFSLFEYWFIKKEVKNYIIAKTAGLLALQLFIVGFFYIYTFFLGKEILLLDILSYIIGCILCQIIVYRLYIQKKLPAAVSILCVFLLIIHVTTLLLFTYYPPRLTIFKDDNSGEYGTKWNHEEEVHTH
ncbi:hypothetical protein KKH43_05040 [Patescibacteria group bacterium]|nr:hypothetical protein [Patescibacteria group bacterium]